MQDTSHLFIEFYYEAVVNEAESREQKRPVHDNIEMIRIKFVGDSKNVHVAPANEMSYCPERQMPMSYAERFPRHYKAFKEETEMPVDGTPLSELPGMLASKIADLKKSNVHTIEQLAALEGTPLRNLGMQARVLKDQAQDWLDKADGNKLGDLERQVAELKAQLASKDDPKRPVAKPVGKPAAAVEVVETGPFTGMTKKDLRALWKEHTGEPVKGQPGISTLVEMLTEYGVDKVLEAA